MYAMPKALPEYRHFKFAGEIVYNNRTERVPQGGIDRYQRFSDAVAVIEEAVTGLGDLDLSWNG